MTKLLTPADTGTLNIDGHEYTPDEDGHITVVEPSHMDALLVLGCTDPDAPPVGPVVAAEPPEVPEPYMSEEAVRALIGENEDLNKELTAAKTEIALRTGENDQLRDRVQELEGLLAAARATETATEGAADAAGSESGTVAGGDTEEAPENPIKEVDGIVVSDPEAFDAMEYNPLKVWLAAHGVHVPANMKKADAIVACKTRFVELMTPAA